MAMVSKSFCTRCIRVPRGKMAWDQCDSGRMTGLGLLLFVLYCGTASPPALGFTPGQRLEVTQPGKGHEVHLSGAAIAAPRDGGVVLAWTAAQKEAFHVYVARPGVPGGQAVRVNPGGLTAESQHQSPGLAIGPQGEIYVSWSAYKPRPEGTLFASDLYLSRSLDGGQSFELPLRINEDRPISHSFEGIAVAADGRVCCGMARRTVPAHENGGPAYPAG